MKLLKQPSPLKRSQSESDQSLRIAYWRDPKKVAIERRTYKRKGIDPPKQAVVQRLYDEGSFNLIHIVLYLFWLVGPDKIGVHCKRSSSGHPWGPRTPVSAQSL